MLTEDILLQEAKKISKLIVSRKWTLIDTECEHSWDKLLLTKKATESVPCSIILQNIGVLKKNQFIYFDEKGELSYKVYGSETVANTKSQLFNYFDLIRVNTLWKNFKTKAKAGDICGWPGHISIYKESNVWYDWGQDAVNNENIFVKNELKINRDMKKCLWILRLKDKYQKNNTVSSEYYDKYTGNSVKIDTVFKAIGVPSMYYGSANARKPIAIVNSILDYKDSSSQNLRLITYAKRGTLRRVN